MIIIIHVKPSPSVPCWSVAFVEAVVVVAVVAVVAVTPSPPPPPSTLSPSPPLSIPPQPPLQVPPNARMASVGGLLGHAGGHPLLAQVPEGMGVGLEVVSEA